MGDPEVDKYLFNRDFTIINAREEHFDAIQEIEKEEWREEEWREDLSFKHFREIHNINPEYVLVALDKEGNVLGYAAMILQIAGKIKKYPNDFDPNEAHKPKGKVAYIAAHGVRENLRRKGIGRALIAQLKEYSSKSGFERIALTYNLALESADYWAWVGFYPKEETKDPNWSPIKGGKPTGAVLYECVLIA